MVSISRLIGRTSNLFEIRISTISISRDNKLSFALRFASFCHAKSGFCSGSLIWILFLSFKSHRRDPTRVAYFTRFAKRFWVANNAISFGVALGAPFPLTVMSRRKRLSFASEIGIPLLSTNTSLPK